MQLTQGVPFFVLFVAFAAIDDEGTCGGTSSARFLRVHLME